MDKINLELSSYLLHFDLLSPHVDEFLRQILDLLFQFVDLTLGLDHRLHIQYASTALLRGRLREKMRGSDEEFSHLHEDLKNDSINIQQANGSLFR